MNENKYKVNDTEQNTLQLQQKKQFQNEQIDSERQKINNQNQQQQEQQQEQQPEHKHDHLHYDPDTIPPNFEIANHHQRSIVVGKEIPQSNGKYLICECCSRKYDRQQLTLNCNLKELSYLGAGFPLYFEFLKYVIFILLIILMVSGVYNIISSLGYGDNCKDVEHIHGLTEEEKENLCSKNWVTIMSLGNKADQDDLMTVQSILNLAATIIVIIALQLFRRNQRQTEANCDTLDIAANDYTVMIKRIPNDFDAKNNDYDEDLKEFLENNLFSDQKTQIKDINLCYKLQEYYKILKDKQKHILNKQKALQKIYKKEAKLKNDKSELEKQQKIDEDQINRLNQEILKEDQKLEEFHDKFFEGKGRDFMKKYFSGFAFVSFDTEHEKDLCLEMYKGTLYKSKKQITYQGSDLVILEAAKAKDVFWQNFHMRRRDIAKRIIIGSIITLILLFVCFWIIFGITEGQLQIQESATNSQDAKNDSTIIQLMAAGLGIVITIVNAVLSILIVKITEFESHRTRTEHNIQLSKKLAIAQFINSSIINFLIQTIFTTSDKTEMGIIFGQGGLAQNQNFVFISQCFLPLITEFINIPWLIKKLQQKQQQKLGQKSVLTQEQLQEVFQNVPFDIEQKYAALLNLIYTTVFYAPILPQALVYTILSIMGLYWLHKYNLIYKTTVSFACGSELSLEIIEMMEYVLPIFSASNLFFYIFINGKDGVNFWTITPLVIGLLHAFLPMQKLNKYLFKIEESQPNEQKYDEARLQHFSTDYARENPATLEQARKQYLHQQAQHQHHLQEQQDKINSKQEILFQQQVPQQQNNINNQQQNDSKEQSWESFDVQSSTNDKIQSIQFNKYQPAMNRDQIKDQI